MQLTQPRDEGLLAAATSVLVLSNGGHALVRLQPAKLFDFSLDGIQLRLNGERVAFPGTDGLVQLCLTLDQNVEAAYDRFEFRCTSESEPASAKQD